MILKLPRAPSRKSFNNMTKLFHQFGQLDKILCILETTEFGAQNVLKRLVGFVVFIFFYFKGKWGQSQRLNFPHPGHTPLASRLACPKSKTGLVTPHRAVPRGHQTCQACTIYCLCTSLCNYCLLFLFMSSSHDMTVRTVQFCMPFWSPCISHRCFQKTGQSS